MPIFMGRSNGVSQLIVVRAPAYDAHGNVPHSARADIKVHQFVIRHNFDLNIGSKSACDAFAFLRFCITHTSAAVNYLSGTKVAERIANCDKFMSCARTRTRLFAICLSRVSSCRAIYGPQVARILCGVLVCAQVPECQLMSTRCPPKLMCVCVSVGGIPCACLFGMMCAGVSHTRGVRTSTIIVRQLI